MVSLILVFQLIVKFWTDSLKSLKICFILCVVQRDKLNVS